MAWEERGRKSYYYCSVRADGRVRKVYHGSGPVGQIAADADALRRAEQKAQDDHRRAFEDQLADAQAFTRKLCESCELLTAAALLAADYHRPARHFWRIWRHGRKALRNAV